MKKDKTPKGLISGELDFKARLLDFGCVEMVLKDYYQQIIQRQTTTQEKRFIVNLLNLLEEQAKNTKK
jgi:hypothetical protein